MFQFHKAQTLVSKEIFTVKMKPSVRVPVEGKHFI